MSKHARPVEIDEKTKLALLVVGEAARPALHEFRLRWIEECKKRHIRPAIATAACIDFVMLPLIRQVFLASGLRLKTVNEIDAEFYHALLAELAELLMESIGQKIALIKQHRDESN